MADDAKIDITTVKVFNALRGLALIVVPIVVAIISIYSTASSVSTSIHRNASDIRANNILHDERYARIQQHLEQLRDRLDSHMRMGPGGVGHPGGVMSDIRSLEDQVKLLEKRVQTLERHRNATN